MNKEKLISKNKEIKKIINELNEIDSAINEIRIFVNNVQSFMIIYEDHDMLKVSSLRIKDILEIYQIDLNMEENKKFTQLVLDNLNNIFIPELESFSSQLKKNYTCEDIFGKCSEIMHFIKSKQKNNDVEKNLKD